MPAKRKTHYVEEPAKPGRPFKKLDEGLIYRLAQTMAPVSRIAVLVGTHPDTLNRNYAAIISKGYEDGKQLLSDLQWTSAKKGNITMQIFLGKQHLGQRDKFEEESTASNFTVNVYELPK
jgi:hypothetical protein